MANSVQIGSPITNLNSTISDIDLSYIRRVTGTIELDRYTENQVNYIDNLNYNIPIPSIRNTFNSDITEAYGLTNRQFYALKIPCGYPVFDGYIIFPQGVRIELLNKPSDDFLKEIELTHKAVWEDRNK